MCDHDGWVWHLQLFHPSTPVLISPLEPPPSYPGHAPATPTLEGGQSTQAQNPASNLTTRTSDLNLVRITMHANAFLVKCGMYNVTNLSRSPYINNS